LNPPMRSVGWFALAVLALGACAHSQSAAAPAYGAVMADVGRRFEVLGRALAAGRVELAEYELGELEETFSEALPHAAPPKEGHPEVLPELERDYLARTLPALRRALAAKEPATRAGGFSAAAEACNACHQASGHGFIEISGVPGHAVPSTEPVVPAP